MARKEREDPTIFLTDADFKSMETGHALPLPWASDGGPRDDPESSDAATTVAVADALLDAALAETGTIEITRGKLNTRIGVEAGRIRFVRSSDRSVTLATHLLANQIIDEETLAHAQSEAQEGDVPLSSALEESGAATREQLEAARSDMARERVLSLFDETGRSDVAKVTFKEGTKVRGTLDLDPARLAFEGLRRAFPAGAGRSLLAGWGELDVRATDRFRAHHAALAAAFGYDPDRVKVPEQPVPLLDLAADAGSVANELAWTIWRVGLIDLLPKPAPKSAAKPPPSPKPPPIPAGKPAAEHTYDLDSVEMVEAESFELGTQEIDLLRVVDAGVSPAVGGPSPDELALEEWITSADGVEPLPRRPEEPQGLLDIAGRRRKVGDSLGALLATEEAVALQEAGGAPPRKTAELHREIGREYLQRYERFDKAVEHLLKCLEPRAADVEASAELRRLYLDVGDFFAAEALYEAELGRSRDANERAQLLKERGQLRLERLERPDEARGDFDAAVRAVPGDDSLLEEVASLYLRTGDPEGDEVQRANLRHASFYLYRAAEALVARDRRETSRARHLLRRALSADAENGQALGLFARLCADAGRWDELSSVYREARERADSDEERIRQHMELANLAERKLRRPDAAIGEYEAIVQIDPSHKEAVQRLRDLYKRQSSFDKLATLLERERLRLSAQEFSGERAAILTELASIYHGQLKRDEDAAERLRDILTADPQHPKAIEFSRRAFALKGDWKTHADLLVASTESPAWDRVPPSERSKRIAEAARIYEERLGDLPRALALWQRVLKSDPTSRRSQDAIARISRKTGLHETALRAAEKEVREAQAPERRVAALLKLAAIYHERIGDLARAEAAYAELFRLAPSDDQVLRKVGNFYQAIRRWDGLVPVLWHRLALGPAEKERKELLRRFAQISHERLGDHERALAACRELLTLDPGDVEALDRMERIATHVGDAAGLVEVLEYRAEVTDDPSRAADLASRAALIAERDLGDAEAAARAWDRAIIKGAADPASLRAAAGVYSRAGSWEAHADMLRRLIEALPVGDPERLSARREAATALAEHLGNAEGAEEEWRAALAEAPDDAQSLLALSDLIEQREDLEGWAELAGRLLVSGAAPGRARDILRRLVDTHADLRGHPEDAAASLRLYLNEVDPADADLRLELAQRLEGLADYREAVAELEKLMLTADRETHPVLALKVYQLWEVLSNQEQGPGAEGGADDATNPSMNVVGLADALGGTILAAERMRIWEPEGPWPEVLAELYRRIGDWERALELDEELIDVTQDTDGAVSLLLRCARTVGRRLLDLDSALGYLRLAYERYPGHSSTFPALAEAYKLLRRHELLYELYLDAAARSPDAPIKWAALAAAASVAEEEMGDAQKAFDAWRGILAIDPSETAPLHELERIAEKMQDKTPILKIYNAQALRLEDRGERVNMLRKRAAIFEDLGDRESALEEWVRAFQTVPGDAEALGQIGRLSEATGQYEPLLDVTLQRSERATDRGDKASLGREAARIAEEKLRDGERALDILLDTLRLDPMSPETAAEAARVAQELDAEATAVAQVESGDDNLRFVKAQERLASTYGRVAKDEAHLLGERVALFRKQAALLAGPIDDPLRAVDVLWSAHKLDPLDDSVVEGMERVAREGQIPGRVLAYYQDAAEEALEAVDAVPYRLRAAGILYRDLREPSRAEDEFRSVLAMQPDHAAARDGLVALYRSEGRWNDLVGLLEEEASSIPKGPGRAAALLPVAVLWQERLRNYREAVAVLKRALSNDPDCEEARASLVPLFTRLGDWRQLLELLARDVEGPDPEISLAARRWVAEIWHRKLQVPKRAIEAYRSVLDMAPDDDAAADALAELLHSAGEWELLADLLEQRAVRVRDADLEQCIAYVKQRADILTKHLDRAQDAAFALEPLLEERPRDEDLYSRLAEALEQAQELDALASALERWGAIASQDADGAGRVQLRLADVLRRAGRAGEATEAFEAADRLGAGDASASGALAELYADEERWQEAVEAHLAGARKASDPVLAAEQLAAAAALCEQRLDDRPRARDLLEDSLRQTGSVDDVPPARLLELARLRDETGSHMEARELCAALAARSGLPAETVADSWILSGWIATRSEENPDVAVEDLEKALQAAPSYLPAVAEWIAVLSERGPLAEMAEELGPRIKETIEGVRKPLSQPERVYGWIAYGVGCTYAGAGFSDEAVDWIGGLLEQRPTSLPLLIAYAEALDRADRWEEAPEVFDTIVGHEDGDKWGGPAASVLHRGGLLMLEAGYTERAAALLERAVDLGGDAHPAQPALAAALLDLGDPQGAQARYERALGAAPDDSARASLLLELADVASRRLDNPAQAEQRYREALELVAAGDPLERAIRVRLLDCLMRLERWKEFVDEAEKVVTSTEDPSRKARYLVAAARAMRELKDAEGEERVLRDALLHEPEDAAAFAALVRVLEEAGRYVDAAEMLSARADAAPAQPSGPASRAAYLKRHARILRDHLGQEEAAIIALAEACELDPGDAVGAVELAQLYSKGDRDIRAAIEAHRIAVRADPSRIESILAVAELAERTGQKRLAATARGVGAALGACEAPAPVELDPEPSQTMGEVLARDVVHPDARALAGVFRALFEAGGLLFRQRLQDLGVRSEDRISPIAKEPVARAFLWVNRALPVKTLGLFRHESCTPEEPLKVVSTNPPALLARVDERDDERWLRFSLGRTMQLARPEFVLVGALPEERLRLLYTAIFQAFEPEPDDADVRRRRADEEVTKLVERLRRGIPAAAAARVEAVLCEDHPQELRDDYARWRAAVEHTINRVGFIACGDPGVALVSVGRQLGIEGAEALREALADEPLLRDLVGFALSDEYLASQRALLGAAS